MLGRERRRGGVVEGNGSVLKKCVGGGGGGGGGGGRQRRTALVRLRERAKSLSPSLRSTVRVRKNFLLSLS